MVVLVLKITVMVVIKVPLKKEENKGQFWAKFRFILVGRLGLPGRFIARIITMVWLRYLYILGPKLKTTLVIDEFHSLLSLEPKIDQFFFARIGYLERLYGQSTSYEKLLVALRKYANDQDLKNIKDIKPRANILICTVSFIVAFYPIKIKSRTVFN